MFAFAAVDAAGEAAGKLPAAAASRPGGAAGCPLDSPRLTVV